jgi:hypothetical protein
LLSDTSLIKDQEIIIAVFLQFLANLSKEVVMGINGLNDIMLYHKILKLTLQGCSWIKQKIPHKVGRYMYDMKT